MSNLACVLWWLIPGVFLGWLASWLFDMAFARNGTAFVETAKADLAKLNAKNQSLDTELTATKARAASASSEQARLNAELSVIRTAQDEATSRLGLLQTDLEGRTANLGKYADEVAALRNQLQVAKGTHDAADRALAALRAEGEQSKSAMSALRGELEAAKTAGTALRGELEVAKTAGTALRAELDSSKRSMVSLQSDAEAAKTGGAAELAQLRANYDASQKAVAAASADIAALRGQLAAAKAAQDTMQSTFASTSTQFDGAKGTIAKLQAELDAARAETTKLQGELGKVQADGSKSLGLLQSDLSGQKDALAAAVASSERLKLELADARMKVEHLNELKTELAALRTQYETTQGVASRLKGDLEAGEVNTGKLRMELSSAQAKMGDHEKLIALLREEIAGKQRSHEAMSGRVSDIELAQQLEHERRTAMTRYGFVSRTRDRDDLTLVEGIGPKIEEVLIQARIDSHSKLAMSSVEDIERVLERAGPQFKIANPGTWPRQAAMIVRGDFAELRRWQDELIAGVEMPKDNT
jgi:chromosome segregation ATPase